MKFRKLFLIALAGIVFGIFPIVYTQAQDNGVDNQVVLNFFYGDGCPHCAKEKEFLKTMKEKYGDTLQIHQFEVYYNAENVEILQNTAKKLGIDVAGVPLTIIGDKHVVGFGSADSTGAIIEGYIEECKANLCTNVVENIPSTPIQETQEDDNEEPININTYLFGEFDLKSVSLPLATIIIAFVDGFNPCAMWILIFLITMLINMEDKRKLYILGTVFILTSGIVYFGFLAAWLNLFQFIGYAYWLKVIIGMVAIVSGYLHIKNGLFSKGECHVTNVEQRKSITERIKRIINEKSYLFAIIGIVLLAISVNFIEVVCSAGLPAVYTNLLSTIELHPIQHYLYLLLYVIIFMIDDLLVFFIAIKTLEVTGITRKYSKWSSIIGGVLIFIIGIILIFKPELLMFG